MNGYRIALDARKDLDGIWDYIAARSNAEIATAFIWRFYETFKSIASSPAAGIVAHNVGPEGTRKFPAGNYIIYYQAGRGRKVVILPVLHGKRKQERAWSVKP